MLAHTQSPPPNRDLGREAYSVEEVARLCGLSERYVYQAVREGTFPIPTRRFGRRIVVPRAALERYLAGAEAAR